MSANNNSTVVTHCGREGPQRVGTIAEHGLPGLENDAAHAYPHRPRPQRSPRRRGRPRRGTAAVEFAFVIPVFCALVFGAIEFSRALMVCNVLTTAAREGARTGVLPNSANSNITTAVQSELTINSLPTGSATITVQVNNATVNASTSVTGDSISVTVSMPYTSVSWIPIPKYLSSATLSARAVMRRE